MNPPFQLLAAAMQQMPAAVVVADAATGEIVLVNEQYKKIWQRDAPPRVEDGWPLSRALRHGERIEGEDLRIERDGGTPAVIRVSAAPIRDEHGTIVAAVATFIDVTAEANEQNALQFLSDASAAVAESLDYDGTLQAIVRSSIPRFADVALVYLLDEKGRLTRHELAAAEPDLERRLRDVWSHFPIAERPILDVIEAGRARSGIAADVDDWSFLDGDDHRDAVRDLGITSAIVAPMRSAGKSYGALVFARRALPSFQPFDVTIADDIGHRAAGAIERSRLFTAEREQRNRVEHLHALTAALAIAITTDEVCDAVLREARELIHASICVIALLDEGQQTVQIVRAAGIENPDAVAGKTFPIDASVPMIEAVRDGEAIWLRNADEARSRSELFRAMTEKHHAWAAVPLSVPGGTIGALGLGFTEEQDFPAPMRDFIFSIARQSAQALERARLFDSERRARREAEQASRAKDEFLAILSHELRTPLTTVIGWADLLRLTYKGDDASIRTAIEALRSSALTQARLIDDLLDVSRIVTGKLRIEKTRTDLTAAVRKAAESLRITAEGKQLTLNIDANEPVIIDGDSPRLQQIVTNLVGNAIKFTPRGGHIDVAVKPHGDEADIVVSDSGEGITREFLPHVFERFRQASVGDSRMHTGLGIGLSIVQHLAQLHGGQVRAESDGGGKGSKFVVTLPVPSAAT